MPFKSKAQRRKFAELLVKGKITEEAYERWNQETGSEKLPEYAHPKSKGKAKGSKKARPRARPKTRAKAKPRSRPTAKSRSKTRKKR